MPPTSPSKSLSPRRKKVPPELAAERATMMNAMMMVVDLLDAMVGPNVEVVLHDLMIPERSIVKIANGHVSRRSVGFPILGGPKNDRGFSAAKHELTVSGKPTHSLIKDYPTVTADGQHLQSATAIFRDSTGEPFLALCLNADMTVPQMAYAWLERLLHGKREVESPQSEAPQMDVLIKEIIADAVSRFGKPVALMNKEEKVHAVESMTERGLFMVKGGVEKAAAALNVTRYTIYNYLDELRERSATVSTPKSRTRTATAAKPAAATNPRRKSRS